MILDVIGGLAARGRGRARALEAGGQVKAYGIELGGGNASPRISIDANTVNMPNVTISFWIYGVPDGNTNETILSFQNPANPLRYSSVTISRNTNSGYSVNLTGWDDNGNATIENNWASVTEFLAYKWNHVLIQYRPGVTTGSSKLYVNDIGYASGSQTYNSNRTMQVGGHVRIGKYDSGTSQTFKGKLAHVYVDTVWRDYAYIPNRRLFTSVRDIPPGTNESLTTFDLKPVDPESLKSVPGYYDSDISLNSFGSSLSSFIFSEDGSRIFVDSSTNDVTYQVRVDNSNFNYTAAENYLTSLGSNLNHSQPSYMILGIYGGYVWYSQDAKLHRFTYTTNDISQSGYQQEFDSLSISGGGNIRALWWTSSTTFLTFDFRVFREYSTASAYNLNTTITLENTYSNLSNAFSDPTYPNFNAVFNSNGTQLFLSQQQGDEGKLGLRKVYNLSSAWDVSTATLAYETYMNEGTGTRNIGVRWGGAFDPTGTYYTELRSNFVLQTYELPTPYDMRTARPGIQSYAAAQPFVYMPFETGTDDVNAFVQNYGDAGTAGIFIEGSGKGNADWGEVTNGPEQLHSNISYFQGDTGASYLQTNNMSGYTISDYGQITVSFVSSYDQNAPGDPVATDTNYIFAVTTQSGASTLIAMTRGDTYINLRWNDASQTAVINCQIPIAMGATSHITVSFDKTDSNKRHVVIDGKLYDGATWSVYNNSTIPLNASDYYRVGVYEGTGGNFYNYFHKGGIGEFYYHTNEYIDLSVENPFWDSTINAPVPVNYLVTEGGRTPMMAMPLERTSNASSLQENNGVGVDFGGGGSVSTIGQVRTRSVEEFKTKSLFLASAEHLELVGPFPATANTKTCSLFGYGHSFVGSDFVPFEAPSNLKYYIQNQTNGLRILGKSGTGFDFIGSQNQWNLVNRGKIFMFSMDMDVSQTSGNVYLNGIDVDNGSNFNTAGLSNVEFNWDFNTTWKIGYQGGGNKCAIGPLYFSTEYIDFSNPNIYKYFVDPLGYPKDLTPAIEAGHIPEPLVYLKFEDLDDPGKNDGIWPDFSLSSGVAGNYGIGINPSPDY